MGFWTDSLVDLVPSALVARDGQGRIVAVNRAFAELFGLSSEDLAGRLPQECGDLDLRRLLRAIDASKEGASQDASAEWSFERGGLKHVLRIRSRVVPRATDQPRIWVSTITDAAHEAAAALADRTEFLARATLLSECARGVIDAGIARPQGALGAVTEAWSASRAVMVRLDVATGAASLVESAGAARGPLRLESVPRPWIETLSEGRVVRIAPGVTREGMPPAERRFLASLGLESLILAPARRAGRLEGLLALGDPALAAEAPGSDAILVAIAEILWSALERRRDLERLSRLLSALDAMSDAIAIANADGNLIEANEAFRSLTGQHSLAGRPLASACPALATSTAERAYRAAMIRGERWRRVLVGSREDGSAHEREWTIDPIRGRGGETAYWLVRSIELASGPEQARRSEESRRLEAVTQLAAGLAHEINTPAQYVTDNVIFARESFDHVRTVVEHLREAACAIARHDDAAPHLTLATDALPANELEYLLQEIPRALDQSREGLHRIADVVRAMRECSDPASGQVEETDINREVLASVEKTRAEWSAVADLETELDPSLPQIPCQQASVREALFQIVANAAQAIARESGDRRRGRIQIRTRSVEGSIEVRITDNGPGIPDEIRERIFDPFFTTREVGEGYGKGLAVARNVIVTQHSGEISVNSQPGAGTTVTVRLPIEGVREPVPA